MPELFTPHLQPVSLRDAPLSDHFRLEEFAQPARHGLPAAPYPLAWVDTRLRPLCELLEALRAALRQRYPAAVIKVLSGYRSPAYNAAIGGAEHSQHMAGRAADIEVPGVPAAEVHQLALELHQAGQIRLGGLGEYPGFTHLDVRPGDLARWSGA